MRVFRGVICPWLPDFSGAERVANRFADQVSFEILDLWNNPSLTEIYGPTPGTFVNDERLWSSPEKYEEKLEDTIREHIGRLSD